MTGRLVIIKKLFRKFFGIRNKIIFLFKLLSPIPNNRHVCSLQTRFAAETHTLKPKIKYKKSVIAVQCVEDPLFFGLFVALTKELKEKIGCSAALVQVYGICRAVGVDWKSMILRSWLISALLNRKWANANAKLVGPVAYRSRSLSYPLGDLLDLGYAFKLWRSLRNDSDISNLKIDNITIGDLVIDSFLRFRPSPRFDVSDSFVRTILWQCLRDLRRAKQWFGNIRPSLYISSYSTYLEHGVAARVALSFGIPVYTYGNLNEFGKRLSSSYYYHTRDTESYRREFETLPEQDACLEQAEMQLNIRLSGGIDSVTAYMKVSAYEISDEAVPPVFGAVVVFMHDFYDSPHSYPDLVFPDFWAWISCTIRTLNDANIPFWIKPHPNQIPLSSQVYRELLDVFPRVQILSTKVTNKQLADAGIICGITVYGTVAHELAYLGIPSIACARHPHYQFDFCRTAKNVEDYMLMLRNPSHRSISRVEMKRQALIFYYMHNLFGSLETLKLRDQFVEFWRVGCDNEATPEDLWNNLDRLRNLPGWRSHIETLIQEIDHP